ncbi:MAG: DEAD/DEAH box helicase [Lentilactobacillus diolivorans]|uniref:DEAD-box ATP-dependent RNA helicase CshA n=2 Tax=Lentilactobacillus diolivorans TaxID=179838 RepID=A0A0R1S7J4_9LACO|nr:DEAD/DEAH box helicase [Lentilactobacillus diolivorans]KRL62307.1 DEAD DEAH box helicase [Lentilactobacillus diolivorans DSM 14421]MCH4163838.1 DEAD/DEAH box helicase [Lentilactobacillus diolivorans]MDH5105342.1 DEAD/DEAH box helicase [Lentilactobacillus diolivorans]GEP23402.1 DEAD-box ATP-dependent RNA helicase CshA [Lentilactobacillus diolivorans]
MKFSELGLSDRLLTAISNSGFEEATPIQAETIPMVLKGEDVIGQAQTGTGKTAAFGLPILQNIDFDNPNVQALIISPTRELAIQTQEEVYRLGKDEKAKVQVVYGGADIRRQINALKGHPQIVVGTPGRILDHIRRHTLKLEHIKTLVLDEADEMLNMGFLDDIESIIKQTPKDRQTLLFSATMPAQIKRVGVQFMKDPHQVKIKAKELTTDLIDQYYVRVKEYEKFDVMTRFFDVQDPEVTIVFCRTKRRVDEVSKGLEARGYKAAGLHGDLTQARRTQIMQQFKQAKIDILVATDVAARGIDISGVTHVYNYDIPQDPDGYVHRVGRTGRAGQHGVSITFATPNEMDYLREIEKLTKVRMLPLKPPTEQEAFVGQLNSAESDIAKLIKHTNTGKYEKMADKLLDEYEATDLVAALLNDITRDNVKVKITPERPLSRHHGGGRRNGGGGHRGGGHWNGSRNRRNGDRNSSHNRSRHDGGNHDRKRNDRSNNKKRRFTIKNS